LLALMLLLLLRLLCLLDAPHLSELVVFLYHGEKVSGLDELGIRLGHAVLLHRLVLL
jgi:hypothetical protein